MPDVYDKEETDKYSPGSHDDLGADAKRREKEIEDLDNWYHDEEADEPDIKYAEQSGAGDQTANRSEKNELDRLGSGYRDEDEKKNKQQAKGNRATNFIRNSSARKRALAASAGLGGVALVIILLFIIGQLKIVHFSQILAASGYARLNSMLNERTAQTMFDIAVADGNEAVVPGKPSLWERLRRTDPTKELTRLGQEGRFKFDFSKERTAFTLRKQNMFQGVTIDGEKIDLGGITKELYGTNSYYKLVDPRKKAQVRYEFSQRTQKAISEKFATQSRLVRSAAAKSVMDNVGFKFTKWRDKGRKYVGLTPDKAFAENLIETSELVDAETTPTKTGVDSVDKTIEDLRAPPKIREYLEKNNYDPDLTKRVLATYAEHQKTAAKIGEVASKVGQFTMLATMACMTNMAFKSIPETDKNNQKQAENGGLVGLAAGSQVKYGDTTPEAVGAESRALNNGEASPSYQYAVGNTSPEIPDDLNSSNIRSSLSTDSPLYRAVTTLTSPSNFILGGVGGLVLPDKLTDRTDAWFCGKLLSPEGMVGATIGEVAVQAVIGFFSAGSGTVASEAGATAAIKGFSIALKDAFASTARGLASKSTLGTLAAFTAYGAGLQVLVMRLSGQSFSGLATGATRVENQFTGVKANQNHMQRSVMYGRPLSASERKQVDNTAQQEIRTTYNSGNTFERYLDTNNPYSASSRSIAYMPASFTDIATDTQHSVATIGSMFSPKRIFSPLLGSKVFAAGDTYDNPEDAMLSWGYSADELELMRSDPSYGIEENSAWVEPKLAELDAKYGVCFTTIDQYDADELAKSNSDCSRESLSTMAALRYRIYKGIDSYIVNDREHGLDEGTSCTLNPGLDPSTSGSLPSWAVMPTVNAPVGGPAKGIIDTATVNARSYDTFPQVMHIISAKNPDFIATNETANESKQRVESVTPGYGAFRVEEKDTTKGNADQSINNYVLWRKDKWDMLQGGRVKLVEDDQVIFKGDQKIWDRFATWGIFKRKTDGAIVSFISTHMPTNPTVTKGQWGDQPFTRAEQYGLGMDILVELTKVLGAHGPVVVGGDMNTHGEEGDWAAEPKMKAAGFDFVKDRGVIYTFNSPGTKMLAGNVVWVPLHNDHDNQSLFAKIDLNNATPGPGSSISSATGDDCSSGSGGTINVATFNIYHSDDAIWKERLRRSTDVLINNSIDVAGLQEARQDQQQLFKTAEYGGSVYEMFPATTKNPGFSPNPIIWNKSKYRLVQTYYEKGGGKTEGKDYLEFTYFNGVKDRAPWVKLQDIATGQEFYFINTHDPADVEGEEAIRYRYENAKHYAAFFKELSKEGLPIFFTGDFNSGYRVIQNQSGSHDGNNTWQDSRANLTYCILTNNTGLWDSYDAWKKKQGTCPSTGVNFGDRFGGSNANPIDHIFTISGVSVTKYWRSPGGKQQNGSDVHDTIMATASFSPTNKDGETGGSGGKLAWPITRSDYVPLSNCYEKPGHTGIDIPVSNGTPVHAAGDGTVVKTGGPSGDAGNYIIISHGGDRWTNYQHLSRIVVRSGHVNQGDVIGFSGNTGYVIGSNGGYHLHFSVTNKEGLDSRSVVAYSLNPLNFLPKDGRNLGVCG